MLFKIFACDLRPLSRMNGTKYAFMIMILLSSVYSLKKKKKKLKELCIQYDAQEVYIYFTSKRLNMTYRYVVK